ncbi:MAG TPA: DUF58 domain-containing protein [Solirubrobacteraceae bacterium]|jgi:uncharacterized protein (DUF58 family)|nr:DUF58 domain-containing protein [Solirubrobacteraceae bacterium]
MRDTVRPAPPRLLARRAAVVVACGVVLCLVSLIFDAAPLFVPAVGLLALGLGTPAWVWLAAKGAATQRHLPAARVIEDEPVDATIEVRRGRLGLPGAEVVDPFTGSRFELAGELSPVKGDRTTSVRVTSRFVRRGLHRLPAPALTVRDPLDLARAETVSRTGGQQVLVLPRTEPVRWLVSGHSRRLRLPDGHAGSEALAAVDLDGLRPYRKGTPASRIHWPAVARGHGLIERRLQADGDTRPLVVLDVRTSASAGRSGVELVDAAVRAAASLVLEFGRAGGCGLVLPGEQRPTMVDRELIAWPAAYARLALVEGGSASRAPVLGPMSGRGGAMIYVAASPVERLGAVLSGPGGGPTVLVVPEAELVSGHPRGVRSARPTLTVSGCHGFQLGAGRRHERTRPEDLVA